MSFESNTMYSMIIIDMDGKEEQEYIQTNDLTRISMLCGFKKNADHFKHIHAWLIDKNEHCFDDNDKDMFLHVYASTKGYHENINKFELPPPIDNTLYYGYIAIVLEDEDHQVCHLDINTWKQCYEILCDGFYELGDTDTEEDEGDTEEEDENNEYEDEDGKDDGKDHEDNEYEEGETGENEKEEHANNADGNQSKEKQYTKDGYLIDDFVVDDDTIEYYEEWV